MIPSLIAAAFAAALSLAAPQAAPAKPVIRSQPVPVTALTTTTTTVEPVPVPEASSCIQTADAGGWYCGDQSATAQWYRNPSNGSCVLTDDSTVAGTDFYRDDTCSTNPQTGGK